MRIGPPCTFEQARRHGGGGGGLSAQRWVMSMMVIPLPHYDKFWGISFFFSKKKNALEPPPPLSCSATFLAHAVAKHFALPKQTPWRRPFEWGEGGGGQGVTTVLVEHDPHKGRLHNTHINTLSYGDFKMIHEDEALLFFCCSSCRQRRAPKLMLKF